MNIKSGLKVFGQKVKENGPDILMYGGLVGAMGSTFLASRASYKLVPKVEQFKSRFDAVEYALIDETRDDNYTVEDAKKDRYIITVQSVVDVAKLYAPAVILGTVSVGCILKSHNMLKQQVVSLTAAYTTLAVGFSAYQERVAAKYGEEQELAIRYGTTTELFEGTEINEKGKEKSVTKEVQVIDENAKTGPYSDFFMQGNDNWEKDQSYNLMFLTSRQQYANDLLKMHKKVYLNDVRKLVGLPITDDGQMVGWIYDPENPEHNGDNYIDFGIKELTLKQQFDMDADYRNPKEPVILLTFNVDKGIVWKKKAKGGR